MPIPINRLGLVVSGQDAGLYVRVEPVKGGTGLLILKSDYADMQGGEHAGDDWVQDAAALERYFSRSRVDWTVAEPDYVPPRPAS